MNEQENPQEGKPVTGLQIRQYFFDLVKDFLDLDKGVDKWGTIQDIKSKQSMSGANAWMLMCSILIASIGLNLDSQAVIIGAMLISPLMSPILGVGLGVAINDKDALYHALLHFGAAILIALFFSTLYFWLIPLDEFTTQIQARTEPTFLDVLIGVFGGVAGIVSYARKDLSTTIPGVAIATALMPPLCVTGYGLANGDWDVASKSFYLFFLNSFFVAFATYVVLRYLKFPYKEYASKKDRRTNITIVAIFSLLMMIPSFIIFSKVYKDYLREDKIQDFIRDCIGEDDIFLDNYTLKPQADGSSTLYLKVYGESINESRIPQYERFLDSLGVKNVNVAIIPTSEIPLQKVRQLETELSEVGTRLNSQINQLKEERDARQKLIENINKSPQFVMGDTAAFRQAVEEVRIFMPDIDEMGLSYARFSDFENADKSLPTAIIKKKERNDKVVDQLQKYLKRHFELDTIRLIFID